MAGYPFDRTYALRAVPAGAQVFGLDVPSPRLTIGKLVVTQASGVKGGFIAVFYNSGLAVDVSSISVDAEGNEALDPAVYQIGPALSAANNVATAAVFNVTYPFESQDLHQLGMRDRKIYLLLTPVTAGADFHVSIGGFLPSTA